MSSEGASTSTADSKEKMDAAVQALNMLAQGKRNLLCQEVPTAVQQFQEACQMLSSTYGELAKECADAYYYYGVGLLELSRMESGVLGNALQGVDVDADENADEPDDKEKEQFEPVDKLTEDERDKLRDQVYDAMAEDETTKVHSKDGGGMNKDDTASEVNTDLEMPKVNGDLEMPKVNGDLGAPKVNGDLGALKVDGDLETPKVNGGSLAPKLNGDVEPMEVEAKKAGGDSEIPPVKKPEVIKGENSSKEAVETSDKAVKEVEMAEANKGEDNGAGGEVDGEKGSDAKLQSGDVVMETDVIKTDKREAGKEENDANVTSEMEKEESEAGEKGKDTAIMEKTNDDASKAASENMEGIADITEEQDKDKEADSEEKPKEDKSASAEPKADVPDGMKDEATGENDKEEIKEGENKTKSPESKVDVPDSERGDAVVSSEKQGEKMEVQEEKDEKKSVADGEGASKEGEASTEGKEKEGAEAEEEDGEEEGEEGEEEEAEGEAAEGEEGEAGEDNKDEDDADDIPNLQLAWEMLELSKVIYLKDDSKESKLKAAQSYLKLGEVSMETESYENAIEDIKSCLKIQEECLEPDDRLIAETHYQLGLAYQLSKQCDSAIDHFRGAIKCLESRIEHLKRIVEEKPPQDPSEFLDPAQKAAEEIKDIEKILPDIRDKIEDAQEELKSMDSIKTMAKEVMGQVFAAGSTEETGFTSTSKSSPTKSAGDQKTSDITHLIRKKRKPEDEAAENDADSKKPRQEGAEGDAESKPVAELNGHAEKPEDKPAEVAEPMATA